MNVEETKLDNDLRVITRTTPGASAAIGAFTNIGSRHETEANNGVAHFLEHMAFKGTETRTAADISGEIEILGAYINAHTSQTETAYYVKGLVEHMTIGADILGDALTNSKYDNADIKLEGGVVLQEISQYEDDPVSTMIELMERTAYPNQPVGRAILGSKEFVANARHNDFKDFVTTNYSSETMVVIAAGGVDHQQIVDAVSKSFASIPATTSRAPVVPATYVGGLNIDRSKDFSQASIGIMFNSVPVCDASSIAHTLLMDAFGGGMSSPLFQEIREKRGLVYHTGAFGHAELDYGYSAIYGMLTPDNIEKFIKVSCSELAKLCDNIRDDDLTRARNGRLVNLAFSQESAVGTIHQTANDLFKYGRIREFNEIKRQIESITIDDLKSAAKRLLSTKPSIALVGPVPEADYEGMVKSALGV